MEFSDDIPAGSIGCLTFNITIGRVALGLGFLLHSVDVGASVASRTTGEQPGILAINVVPPPSADLSLSALNVSMAEPYMAGDTLSANISYENVGTESGRGFFCFVLFASVDSVLDVTDVEIGRDCIVSRLDAGNSRLHQMSVILPALATGPYKVIAYVNGARFFPENNFDNNVLAQFGVITVDVIEIGPVPVLIPLQPGNRTLVRMRAAGGVGLTINVTSNATRQTAFNKVWVRNRYVPTSASFDMGHEDPFAASHFLTLSEPRPGWYYMIVEADAAADDAQNLSLSAINSTFSLDSVSPIRLGRNGNVTLHIRGRELRSTMRVYLDGMGVTRDATTLYWFSSTDVWATFSTVNLTSGTYVLRAIDGEQNVTLIQTLEVFDGSPVSSTRKRLR